MERMKEEGYLHRILTVGRRSRGIGIPPSLTQPRDATHVCCPKNEPPGARRKHFSAQRRGVTTSYKNEEQYTHFHKISFFLVVMGIVIGLGSHGIDEGIE